MYTCNCSGNNKFPRCCSRNCRSLVKHKKKKLFIPISAATLPISFLPLHPYTYILHSCLLERTSQINSKKENKKRHLYISQLSVSSAGESSYVDYLCENFSWKLVRFIIVSICHTGLFKRKSLHHHHYVLMSCNKIKSKQDPRTFPVATALWLEWTK